MTAGRAQPLILLFGLPRSGTSWIGKIFDSHPDTLYKHEPDAGGLLDEMPLAVPAAAAERYRATIEGFVRRLPSFNSTKVSASLPVFRKSYYGPAGLALHRLGVAVAKASGKLLKREVPVPTLTAYRRAPQLRLVWKSVESIGRLGAIVRVVPECRAVLIIRHPCGFVSSVLRGEAERKFTAEEPASENYGVMEALLETPAARTRGLDLALMRTLHPVERLAWRWVLFNETALADVDGVAGCTSVRYEDVCADPHTRARDLLEFAGLPWSAQTEDFVSRSTAQDSQAYYSIFKDPVRSATSWRTHLPTEHIDRVFRVLRGSRLAPWYAAE